MTDAPQMCPSCAGQLSSNTETCPWCGNRLVLEPERTIAVAPSKPPVTRPDVGFGETSGRPLPPLPPPPRSLPFTEINSTQVVLRVIIIVAVVVLFVLFGRRALHDSACMVPNNPLCPGSAATNP